ncbi:toxin-antitoxin system YwqK family antitoxin [Flavobacteriaceae bacterium SZ-1-7]|uniref:toxin-antitoxin system YwqK family antitoxin n=1 Tax=Tamlana sedimenti TaxID=3134126 RepID=UPI0031280620
MKFTYSLLVFLMSVNFLLAQTFNQLDSEGKRHGKWKKNYDNTDILRYEGEFSHGKEIGLFKFYKKYRNKAVLSATKLFNTYNNLVEVKFFTSTGKLVSEGQMDGRTYVGEWKYYQKYTDGLLILEHYNNKGELDGERLVYYPNGQVAEKQTYVAGKLYGESLWYSENKVLLKSYVYEDDELHGKAKFFNAQGELISEGTYKRGKKDGVWKYYEHGKLVNEENFSYVPKPIKKTP